MNIENNLRRYSPLCQFDCCFSNPFIQCTERIYEILNALLTRRFSPLPVTTFGRKITRNGAVPYPIDKKMSGGPLSYLHAHRWRETTLVCGDNAVIARRPWRRQPPRAVGVVRIVDHSLQERPWGRHRGCGGGCPVARYGYASRTCAVHRGGRRP